MIDVRILRENPELVRESQKKRGEPENIVDEVLKIDKEWREVGVKLNKLEHERNTVNLEIVKKKKEGNPASAEISKMKKVAERIGKLKDRRGKLEVERMEKLAFIPNIVHKDVAPVGKLVEVRKGGKIPKFGFDIKDHQELGEKLGILDIERAAKISGARFGLLKGAAVDLEFAIVNYCMESLKKEGFVPVVTPALVNEKTMFGTGFLPRGEKDIYKIERDDLYLVGTSEVPLAAMHMDEILKEDSLPLKYAGFSTCFRREAGTHGKDTRGIFRVHQFDKVEMFVFCRPEESWKLHEEMTKIAEDLVKGLDLPYHVVNIPADDLGDPTARKYDIEVWVPSQNKYREIISCSNCTDYQARRLGIRYRKTDADKPEFVHTLNSTALAVGRTLIGIMENGQQKDGSILVPKVLQKYAGKKISV